MIDVDELVASCLLTLKEPEPRLAVKEVLQRTVSNGAGPGSELGRPERWLNILYRSDELTVLDAIWPPKISLFPHDHRMWAAIGIYNGGEDNAFFRRQGSTLASSGGRSLRTKDVILLGDDTIHSVTNPWSRYTGAIHVYGGDFVSMPRSQWSPEILVEEPYDLAAVGAVFDKAQKDFEQSVC
jgi:predicted metal-dependent enzyme (double-stranded beta helix superfamily)